MNKVWVAVALAVLSFGYAFASVGAGAAADAGAKVLITDIDDTIRDTRIGLAGLTGDVVKRVGNRQNAFIGAARVLRGAAAHDATVAYVTAMPKAISKLSENFLAASEFPGGDRYFRSSMRVRSQAHKINAITKILSADPAARAILIGDNGEHDPEIYRTLQEDPELGKRIAKVFIHQAYPKAAVAPLQTPFYTWGDLSVHLYNEGWIDEATAVASVNEVRAALKSKEAAVFERALNSPLAFDPKVLEHHLPELREDAGTELSASYRAMKTELIQAATSGFVRASALESAASLGVATSEAKCLRSVIERLSARLTQDVKFRRK